MDGTNKVIFSYINIFSYVMRTSEISSFVNYSVHRFTHCSYIKGPAIFDYNKNLILLTVIQLSGGHCLSMFTFNIILTSWDNIFIKKYAIKNLEEPVSHLKKPIFVFRIIILIIVAKSKLLRIDHLT